MGLMRANIWHGFGVYVEESVVVIVLSLVVIVYRVMWEITSR